MAKKDTCPLALRGYQVHFWLAQGQLKVAEVGEKTGILLILAPVRVRIGTGHRTTLSQGSFLVPRWILAPQRDRQRFTGWSGEKLRTQGFFVRGGKLHLLLYQQVEGLDHLVRQQDHILFDDDHSEFFNRQIAPYIAIRRFAAQNLIQRRKKQLSEIQARKLNPVLEQLRRKNLSPKVQIGIENYLQGLIALLDEIGERPLVTRRKRAQRSIRCAIGWLERGNRRIACARLEAAYVNLNWPTRD